MPITEYNDFKFKVLYGPIPKYTRNSFGIEKLSGEWPDNEILILLCDDQLPNDPKAYCFGGVVIKHGNTATVDVYID